MPSIAYTLMMTYDGESRKASRAGSYERSFIFEDAVSFVNNIHHGKQPSITLTRVRENLADFLSRETDEDKRTAYIDAIELLDVLALETGIEIPSP